MDARVPLSEASIAARIERLPPSSWHVRMRVIIGTATFFDAFDLIALATVLPVLSTLWKMTPPDIGWLISVGFAGQALGALGFGYLAERIGRINVAVICVAIFSIMSFLCALAQNYEQLVWFRFIQGIGLGGEVPIAAAYINEIAKSHRRGRFFLLYECVFLFGIATCTLIAAVVVPRFGYYWMFILGAVPALITIPLRRYCPESPRWLASRGRLDEADRILTEIEATIAKSKPLPPPDVASVTVRKHGGTRWTELFSSTYRMRTLTVWVLWFCSYLLGYGLGTWMSTIYHRNFNVSVETALWISTAATTISLCSGLACAMLIDHVGRRLWMCVAFGLAAVPLLTLAYLMSGSVAVTAILVIMSSACNTTLTITLYLYTPELYPTRMRALGTAWATFWPRLASITGATMVGYILPVYGVSGVFAAFGCIALVGCICCIAGAIETREKVLEELSP